MKTLLSRCFFSILMICVVIPLWGQGTKRNIKIDKEVISESVIKLKSITNNNDFDVEIIIKTDNGSERREIISQKGSIQFEDLESHRILAYPKGTPHQDGGVIWGTTDTRKEWEKLHKTEENEAEEESVSEEKGEESKEKNVEERSSVERSKSPIEDVAKEKNKKSFRILDAVLRKLEKNPYLSDNAIENDIAEIENFIEDLNNWSDKEAYIEKYNLVDYVKNAGRILEETKDEKDEIIENLFSEYDNYNSELYNRIEAIIDDKLEVREDALGRLCDAIDPKQQLIKRGGVDMLAILNIVLIVLLIIGLIILIVVLAKRKSSTPKNAAIQQTADTNTSQSIVVRRKTTSILKKQSLVDVVDNSAYLTIECSEFSDNTAVRRMYIKNTCIKDIYNMYADDLRNPDNPKEDGCMVLGRWVHDEQLNEYYVSLEEIVRPGDDAVFQEYELNFGGKIKLRIAEKLRKLRRETNLQYDLTCWVHSHPGLGVFFSNSDSGVQMQLKHPTHPKFLTAIVVDILTPQQEFGIFTFKHDLSINSKDDLKKMYSLEELHKWAVESERNTINIDDYYNVLSNAELLSENCSGVYLSNGAIIDMSSITTEQNIGLLGWAKGFLDKNRGKKDYIVKTISKQEYSTEDDLLGCFVMGTHCSIPSIRRAVEVYKDKIKFVIFYSVTDGKITTIPVEDMQLAMNEKYYAEENIEDLKIWTRRRR